MVCLKVFFSDKAIFSNKDKLFHVKQNCPIVDPRHYSICSQEVCNFKLLMQESQNFYLLDVYAVCDGDREEEIQVENLNKSFLQAKNYISRTRCQFQNLSGRREDVLRSSSVFEITRTTMASSRFGRGNSGSQLHLSLFPCLPA